MTRAPLVLASPATWGSTLGLRERRAWRAAPAAPRGHSPLRFEVRYVYTVETPSRRRDPGEPTSVVVFERSAALQEIEPCFP